jgi:hypothetical protein
VLLRGVPLGPPERDEQLVELAARVLVQVEERRNRRRSLGLSAQGMQVLFRDVERTKERLVEQACERVLEPRLAERGHERLELRAEQLERLPQERQLNRPLALLDEVHVRGADPQPARHVHLREPTLDSELAKAPPDVGVDLRSTGAIPTLGRRWHGRRLLVEGLQCSLLVNNVVNGLSTASARQIMHMVKTATSSSAVASPSQ